MLVSTREILQSYKVVPAFNFTTVEVAKAVVETCEKFGSPVILQTSQSEAEFLGLEIAASVVKILAKPTKIPISLHLDHTKNPSFIFKAEKLGYSSAMVDVSDLSFEEGIKRIKGSMKIRGEFLLEGSLCEYEKAKEFIKRTKIDLLAPEKDNFVSINTLRKIRETAKIPLVLHGSSVKSEDEVREAISLGVVKINWNTSLREAWSKVLRKTLNKNPSEIKPYNILKPSVEEVKKVVEEKVKWLLSS